MLWSLEVSVKGALVVGEYFEVTEVGDGDDRELFVVSGVLLVAVTPSGVSEVAVVVSSSVVVVVAVVVGVVVVVEGVVVVVVLVVVGISMPHLNRISSISSNVWFRLEAVVISKS